MKVTCVDCGKKRDAYRPVHRAVDGKVHFACRQCWRDLKYDGEGPVDLETKTLAIPATMLPMTEVDRAALARVR